LHVSGNAVTSNERATQESNMRQSIGFVVLAMLAVAPQSAWALANPASVFCVESGGRSEIRNGPRGQYGVCILPDGRTVDEWAYYRRNHGKIGSGR
jgi:putative hemolysin